MQVRLTDERVDTSSRHLDEAKLRCLVPIAMGRAKRHQHFDLWKSGDQVFVAFENHQFAISEALLDWMVGELLEYRQMDMNAFESCHERRGVMRS